MLYTVGFTKKSAAEFFGLLRSNGVERILDVRLNRTSQLAGFAKERDLKFFLKELGSVDHVVLEELAPTAELLDAYRSKAMTWDAYSAGYTALLKERRVEETVPRDLIEGGCLLCSEHTADKCHRRVAAEYLAARIDGIQITHL